MKPIRSLDKPDPVQVYMAQAARLRRYLFGAALFLLFVAVYWGVFAEIPEDHADIRDHFKYGSIGSDAGEGVPYWIWWVLPDLFPQYLPEPDRYRSLPDAERTPPAAYAQFGFVSEEGHDLPIGFTKRKVIVDRIGLNCAVCHVATVRITPEMDPNRIYGREPGFTSAQRERAIVLGMPAVTVDLGAYLVFLQKCAEDPDFTEDRVMEAIDRRYSLSKLDRLLYRRAVPVVQSELRTQKRDFSFLYESPPSGPGRVDTFNPYKTHVFKFPSDHTVGTADFPSIWNQRPREGLPLHWDGNNSSVFERNISASIGAGANPVTLDLPRMIRVANWLGAPDPRKPLTPEEIEIARADPRPRAGELPIPRFPFPVDSTLASLGRGVYGNQCARCHDWAGEAIGRVVPIEKIGTDRHRLDSFTPELAANQNTIGAGQWWRFRHFRKTNGYVNMPLDGLWARAPYLHNGSVPTLEDLLKPESDRPKGFYRGDDEYDPKAVGFRSDRERSLDGRKLFWFDTSLKGNAQTGHPYGTELGNREKEALLEYLKTL